MNHTCTNCNEPCTIIEEEIDYPGTHCNFGRAGTHRTGHYVSACCDAEVEEE